MSRRAIAALVVLVALVQVAMFSDLTWRKRKQERRLRDAEVAADRFIDIGVELRVVVQDEAGVELIPGVPKLRVLRLHRFGGVVDTAARPPRLVAGSQSPVVWFCSEEQEQVLLSPALKQIVYGSEGAGKTTVLAQWHYLQWLAHLGEKREGLQTAPTLKRLGLVKLEMEKLWPCDWLRYVVRRDFEGFELCDGTRIRMVSTHRQSEGAGSPIQGFNSSWAGRDEMQDQTEVHEDITNRGRSAKYGRYPELGTATAKHSSAWRTLRAMLVKSGKWIRQTLKIEHSPFIAAQFIEDARATMSDREFRRRMGAEDLLPERSVYPSWSREHNCIAIPSYGWEDVTAAELARFGAYYTMLAGHDPGQLFDVTVMLKAFRTPRMRPGMRPIWVVVDEVTTEGTTTEQHVAALLERIRKQWRLNLLDRFGRTSKEGPRLYTRADPYGNNDSKPDRSCYTIFKNAGLDIVPAAFGADGVKPGRVPKEAGIELVNMLLCSAALERRLFVALDDKANPVAPKLVEALESSERDGDGRAETQRKNRQDVSHWPASLRYALWPIERVRRADEV